ncbi:MAG: sugar phosphate isomerase/epimerase [Elusimicrobia bacterium]|nr:sugar phosphate isomerase/epimerase [Elusimicrobiota bacterium]
MIRLGRNFTNLFIVDVLPEDTRNKILSGEIDMFSMNALGLVEFKKNVLKQLSMAKAQGLNHIELDADIPNPYISMSKDDRLAIRKKAEESDITLSVHLPYSPPGIGSAVVCIQKEDRQKSVELHKLYIDFARDIGAKHLNMHPGTAPFYLNGPIWMEKFETAIIESVMELAEYGKGINFHIENNVSFDTLYVEPEDGIRLVQKCRKKGAEIYYNLDIGHWFTRALAPGGKAKPVPEHPEQIMKTIPKELVKELHLNDFVPKTFTFHPPLHLTEGPLQKENLIEYGKIVKTLEPEVIILETASKVKEYLVQRNDIVKEELEYVKECLDL